MAKLAKKRSESFFGLHFDFHPTADIVVGDNLRYDVIAKLLDEVKPDYVQIDTKGHPGLSSYPTKVGQPAPLMRGDQIKMWRELTAERGIALYGHHSGLFDIYQATHHPEWAIVNEDGTFDTGFMSLFGEYDDKFLIPQLKELALDYKLDGAWVDGECWGVRSDYSVMAQEAWAKVSNIPIPKKGEPDYPVYAQFLRDKFKEHVTHYITELKKVAPNFQITSNWVSASPVPGKVELPIDFISGDYDSGNSLNSARIQGRFIANQNTPWDLMAWGHNCRCNWQEKNRSTKEYAQHCQEASFVMAQGGGFQFYNWQYGGGSTVQEWAIPMWARVGQYVREREPFCKGTKPMPQLGIFFPTESHYYENDGIHGGSLVRVAATGLIHAGLDCGYATELLETHNLDDRDLSEYGTLVVPHAAWIANETREKLLKYVENGGGLILADPITAKQFGFGVSDAQDKLIHISDGEVVAPLQTVSADLAMGKDTTVCATYYLDNFMENGPYAAAVTKKYGKGNIVALGFDFGSVYTSNRTTCAKNFFKQLAAITFPNPAVKVEGSDYVELNITRRDNMMFIHLLNYGGPHEVPSIRTFNEIPKLGPLTVTISDALSPKSVTIEPEHKAWTGDAHKIVIDSLEIHTVIAVEL